MIHLSRKTPAGKAENHEDERDGCEHSRDAAEPALEPADRRCEDECEQHGEGDRHEHGLRPIEDHDDEYTTGEYHPRLQDVRRVIHGSHALTVSRESTCACSHLHSVGLTTWCTLDGIRTDKNAAEVYVMRAPAIASIFGTALRAW